MRWFSEKSEALTHKRQGLRFLHAVRTSWDEWQFNQPIRKSKKMTGKFGSIVNGGNGNLDNIFDDWDKVQSADDFGTPLPVGKYICVWKKGELATSKGGTPSYKLTLEVETGEHAGRKVWLDIWLTPASRQIAKRDLEKLGITNPREQLSQPIPKWLRLQVQIGLQTDDSKVERNSVLNFKVLEKFEPEADPFAPKDEPATPAADPFTPETEG